MIVCELKQKYEKALIKVEKALGSYERKNIEAYVRKLERTIYGLKTTTKNLKEDKAKMYGYYTKGE